MRLTSNLAVIKSQLIVPITSKAKPKMSPASIQCQHGFSRMSACVVVTVVQLRWQSS
jgi:hypothetical protein